MRTLLLIGVATAETLDEISLIGRRPGSAVGRIYQEMRSCIILRSKGYADFRSYWRIKNDY